MAQAFAYVKNCSEHRVKCLFEAHVGAKGTEFMLLPGEAETVRMESQHGLISVAFCEHEGQRFTLAIAKERVQVQARIVFTINSQDKHPGNRRYEKMLSNVQGLVQAFASMSLAQALTETQGTECETAGCVHAPAESRPGHMRKTHVVPSTKPLITLSAPGMAPDFIQIGATSPRLIPRGAMSPPGFAPMPCNTLPRMPSHNLLRMRSVGNLPDRVGTVHWSARFASK